MSYKNINPYNGEIIEIVDYLSDTEVQSKLDSSVNAFRQWQSSSFSERAEYIHSLATVFRSNNEAIAQVIHQDMGKKLSESAFEASKCADILDYYAETAESFLASKAIKTNYQSSVVHYQPLGTILGVMPWNFPFWQVVRFMAPTLMAGNTVLLKHAENVPNSAKFIQTLCQQANLPDGVYQNLFISVEQTAEVIRDHRCNGVSVTGSVHAGKAIAEVAGSAIKKHVLELGGSDAFLVLDDADLEKACDIAITSRFSNAGQICVSAKRIILNEKIADNFIALLTEKVKTVNKTLAPMARADLRNKLHKQVEHSIHLGATPVTGCTIDDSHAFYPASILDNVKPGMPAFDDEIFGPVAAIIRAKDTNEMIELANNSCYGLGASIWTKNKAVAQDIAYKLNTGIVFINELVTSDHRLPFGGTKLSGYGKELGELGIKEFTNAKTIVIG